MKKFLSLVLALIMTMSLVTISAGATEYRDLTDKDEIQYEEAVAVLNRIGVITGYEDGSFRPETELTRGAAAKIIVSLMIGPDAASALPNNASPYPDVPAGHTFAGVIGYCKTAGYISGYGDGTFKPANPLTGYAFAKMLLGAIGYKSNIEGFVDTGWTMNVARIGNVAGLFDRISFDGAKSVTRDEACQLALNTLKATMVDYGSANTVVSSTGEVLTVQGSKAQYVTSNNRDINANINRRVINAANNEMTLEFGEEHFKDLRLEHDRYDPAYDVYGHPSNEWSYKKVTIGTFKLPADFTFTKQMAHLEDTVATKEKALGLRGYDTYSTDHRGGYVNWSSPSTGLETYSSPFADATQIHINGWNARVRNDAYKQTAVIKGESAKQGQWYTYDARDINSANKELAPSLSELCDLTDNGVTVEVYVCPVDADFITDVVVTRTQLMEVDRVASDYVELDTIDSDSKDPRDDGDLAEIAGYNDFSLFEEAVSVKDNNYDAYNVLKDLKAGDEVAVVPYTADDGKTWEVGRAYVPETVSGALTNVDIYNTKSKADGNAIAITVGGTTYPIAQWNKDMREIDGTKIRATKKDVTLLLDEMGNAMLAKDVGNSNAWIVVGDYYQATLSSGRVGWFVHGWTIKGDEVDLELGTIRGAAEKYAPGELVKYQVAETGNGEYELVKPMFRESGVNYTEGRRVLKNGVLSSWTEPEGATKMVDGAKKHTGEGIYNISQFANKDGVAKEFQIQSKNSLLPLEFYNTQVDPASEIQATGSDVVHFNYKNATATPDVAVGSGSGECGVVPGDGSLGSNNFYDSNGDHDMWRYRAAPYDDVKFIFVGFDTANGEVEVINVLSGAQNVEYKELTQINRWWKNVGTNDDSFVASPAEAYVDKDGKVKAVVIKSDSAEANLKDLMIITDNKGANTSTKGGAEAPTSGTYYTRQYVSGEDGFKEEKTGYFDRALSVGDVVTGSLQSNGIIRAKNFHAKSYTNRNPDGIYVRGIGALMTQEGAKSKTMFYVGPDHVVGPNSTKGSIEFLGTGVNGGGTLTNAEILTNKDVMGFDHDYAKDCKGLITVDSTTQFIDLRDGRPGNITSLGDLLDSDKCDTKTVELKILLNGNSSSDGFRHAYVIMILEATPEKSAANGAVTITAKDSTGKPIPATKRTGNGTQSDPYVYTLDRGAAIELTATVNSSAVAENAKWDVDGSITNGNVVTAYAPDEDTNAETHTPATSAEFSVTLYDKDKDIARVPAKVYVRIEAGTEKSDTVNLTMRGVLSGSGTVLVQQTINGVTSYVDPVAGTDTYPIKSGAKVTVFVKDPTVITGTNSTKSYELNGVVVTAKSVGDNATTHDWKDTLVIDKLEKALDLVYLGSGDPVGGNEVVTIGLKGGVTASYKAPGTADFTPVVDGKAVTKGGVLRIDTLGNGAAVIGALGVAANSTGAASHADLATKAVTAANTTLSTDTLNSSITLYSVNKVFSKTANVKVTGAGVDVESTNSNGVWMPVGEEMTISGTGFDNFIKSDSASTKTGPDAGTSFTMSDNKDVYVYGAVLVQKDADVTVTVSGDALDASGLVVSGQTLTLAGADTNKIVVKETVGNLSGYGVEATSDNAPAKTTIYKAYLKATLSIDNAAKISVETPGASFQELVLTTQTAAAAIGIDPAKFATVVVTGKADSTNTKIAVDASTDATFVSNTLSDGTNPATAAVRLGTKAVTFTQVAP